MSRRERLLIRGALAALAAMNLMALMNTGGTRAEANTLAEETLGPADAVVLRGATDLTLRNADGRLSWSGQPFARSYSVAFVHVGKALDPLMNADQFVEERDAITEEHLAENQRRRDEIDALFEQAAGMDPQSPQFSALKQRIDELYAAYQQWSQQARAREAEVAARQMEQAYQDIVAAVEVVADRRGIDIVFRFIPLEDEDMQLVSPQQAQLLIRGRTVLKYPDALDITPDVMQELSLE